MKKIIVVAAAAALCVPAAAQQQSSSPAGQLPTQVQSQQEMQRIINEEKQENAEDQVSPSGTLETTGQSSRNSSATQRGSPGVQPPTQVQSQQEMQRIINEEKQENAEDQVSPSGTLDTTGQGS